MRWNLFLSIILAQATYISSTNLSGVELKLSFDKRYKEVIDFLFKCKKKNMVKRVSSDSTV